MAKIARQRAAAAAVAAMYADLERRVAILEASGDRSPVPAPVADPAPEPTLADKVARMATRPRKAR